MSLEPTRSSGPELSERLHKASEELQEIHEQLLSGHVDARILTDFRDAVNRVRTTAWAVQQALQSPEERTQPSSVLLLLAGERVRVAYQLCRVISGDLANGVASPATVNLVQLFLAAGDLHRQLGEVLGRNQGSTAKQ